MNTMHMIPAVLALTLTLACKNRQGTTGQDTGRDPAETQESTIKLGGDARTDTLFLQFERTPCFGMCPAFRIALYRSGHATYEGRAHVEKEGMHHTRVDRALMEAIYREAERIGFFGLEDTYDSAVQDLPSTIIRVQAGGRDKQVLARTGVPPALKNFAAYLDEQLLPLPWRPVPVDR